jgi:hypothetical protein
LSALASRLPALFWIAVLAPAIWSCPSARELPDLEVSDLLDYPVNLRSIAARETTLFFICDPALKECREGAVFFESRARAIRQAGIRPVLLLRGKGPEVRNTVLNMGIGSPVYIDADGRAVAAMLDEDVMPALLLARPGGEVIETVYGGGESLAGNIQNLSQRESHEQEPPPRPAAAEKKGHGTYKLLAAIGALIIIGFIVFAD